MSVDASAERPTGEWNTYDIICAGDTVTLRVNGVEQNRATGVTLTSGGPEATPVVRSLTLPGAQLHVRHAGDHAVEVLAGAAREVPENGARVAVVEHGEGLRLPRGRAVKGRSGGYSHRRSESLA